MATPKPIRILSVEDHPVFREGLNTIIASQPDMLLVVQASNVRRLLKNSAVTCPTATDLIIVPDPELDQTDPAIERVFPAYRSR